MLIQRISNLGGVLPTVYDPMWQMYTNLSPDQIAKFQSFPQDLTNYASFKRWIWEICGQSVDGPQTNYISLPGTNPNLAGMQLRTDPDSQRKVAGLVQAVDKGLVVEPYNFKGVDGYRKLSAVDLQQVYGYMLKWVQTTYAVEAALLAKINADPQAVTTRIQVDAEFQTAMSAVLSM